MNAGLIDIEQCCVCVAEVIRPKAYAYKVSLVCSCFMSMKLTCIVVLRVDYSINYDSSDFILFSDVSRGY